MKDNFVYKLTYRRLKLFKVDEIFDISTPKYRFNANAIKFGGKYRYITRGEANNGIRGYISEDKKFLNDGNTISFGQDTITMFHQKILILQEIRLRYLQPKKLYYI